MRDPTLPAIGCRPTPALTQRKPLRRPDAAAYVSATYGIPCSSQWLAKLAVVGGGPLFHKAGRTPLYPPDALDRWALERLGTAHATTEDHERARRAETNLKRVKPEGADR